MRKGKRILPAQLLPKREMGLGQDQHETYRRIAAMKRFERTHQHRTPADGQKLLGKLLSHAQPLTAGHYHDTLLHNLRCFYF